MAWVLAGVAYLVVLALFLRLFRAVHRWDEEIHVMIAMRESARGRASDAEVSDDTRAVGIAGSHTSHSVPVNAMEISHMF